MKDLLMVAHFTGAGPTGNNRFHDLARRFTKRGVAVELVTSSFAHSKKAQRGPVSNDLEYSLTQIFEPGYPANVSVSRLESHRRFASNLRAYLDQRTPPEVLYCAVPSLDAGLVCARYAQKHSIHLVIDIQDLWPEAFLMVLPRLVPSFVFIRSKKNAKKVYRAADTIVGVSQTYVNRALQDNPECGDNHAVYLGTTLSAFPRESRTSTDSGARRVIRLAYIGTLGRSYDLMTALHAVRKVSRESDVQIAFEILGEGPQEEGLKATAQDFGIDARFRGRLPYEEMAELLSSCDLGLNPIVSKSAASVINKVCDYAAAGLPVLNSHESTEYRRLLERHAAGLNYENGNAEDLAAKMLALVTDPVRMRAMGENSRRMAEELFDRAVTYERLVEHICEL